MSIQVAILLQLHTHKTGKWTCTKNESAFYEFSSWQQKHTLNLLITVVEWRGCYNSYQETDGHANSIFVCLPTEVFTLNASHTWQWNQTRIRQSVRFDSIWFLQLWLTALSQVVDLEEAYHDPVLESNSPKLMITNDFYSYSKVKASKTVR